MLRLASTVFDLLLSILLVTKKKPQTMKVRTQREKKHEHTEKFIFIAAPLCDGNFVSR